MAREYTIGEAAELLQVSRDALRFYEKKDLVAPGKKENGYRFYSEDQMSILMDIIFLRKIQCGIKDIQAMYADGTPEYWYEFIEARIQEEQERIRMHRQMLRQLMVSRHNGEKVVNYLDRYSLCPMPKIYLFSEIMEDFSQARNEWFKAAGKGRGLEHCYIHEHRMPDADGKSGYRCYLMLEEFAVEKLGLKEEAARRPSLQIGQCVHTVAKSGTMSPDPETVRRMGRWAGERGICLTGEIHSHYLWNYQESGRWKESYVEIYMPVAGESASESAEEAEAEKKALDKFCDLLYPITRLTE